MRQSKYVTSLLLGAVLGLSPFALLAEQSKTFVNHGPYRSTLTPYELSSNWTERTVRTSNCKGCKVEVIVRPPVTAMPENTSEMNRVYYRK